MDQTIQLLLDTMRWLARRPRLAVRITRDFHGEEAGDLEFEVENRSGSVTSLDPEIRCTYYCPSKMRYVKGRNRYFVRQSDRHLPPFQPVMLTATPDQTPENYGFSWFRIFTFRPTRGVRTKVRIRNALLESVGGTRFGVERLWFRLTGNVRPDPHSSVDDMERLRRSLGPH